MHLEVIDEYMRKTQTHLIANRLGRSHARLQMARKTFVWLKCTSQCHVITEELQWDTPQLSVGSASYIASAIFFYYDSLQSLLRRHTLMIKCDLLSEFQKPERLLKLLSSKNKDYEVRKQAMFQNICEKKPISCFKIFLPSFTNLFAHSNPQESKTQILTKSLHRALFLVLHALFKALCSELQGYV